jgi:molecular chaperone GrpE (heat shock protein)
MRRHVQKVPLSEMLRDEGLDARTVASERSELLARRHGGQRLSTSEQERLESLTAKLKEILPPVSADDLEALLKMTEELETIRQRARERRRQLERS